MSWETNYPIMVAFILMVMLWLVFFGSYLIEEQRHYQLKRQAIEHGYALHCPKDGRWAWKGECDE